MKVANIKLMEIYNLLFERFGPQGWWPTQPRADLSTQRSQPNKSGALSNDEDVQFEIIVGAILTQNTSWKNVEKALQNLRSKNLLSRQAILAVPEAELAEAIRPSGYYKQKTKKLKAFVGFNGEITRDNLLSIWGIGPETADSILLYAYEKPYFVIDAYTKRLFSRLGFGEKTYDELQELFQSSVPKDINAYKEFHALIVKLGKEFCRNKPLCSDRPCPLSKICKFK